MADDEDDLDSLLDQVEQTFTSGSDTRVSHQVQSTISGKDKSVVSDNIDQEIDSILDDLPEFQDQSKVVECSSKPGANSSSRARPSQPVSTRCLQIVISGSSTPLGCNQGGIVRSCSALRCTSCDLSVVTIDGYKWTVDSDYLFFRNNYPNISKLKTRLKRLIGYRAYACQCSWRAVKDVTECTSDVSLKWVCGGHSQQEILQ